MPHTTALSAILDRSGDEATVAWAHEGKGDVAKLPDPTLAIVAAEKLGNVAALQGVTGPKELRKAASAALHRIRSRGVKVQEKVQPRAVGLGRETVDLASRGFLSLPDPEGDIELLLTASDEEGNCVLGLLLGPDGKVRESNHAHLGRGELRDLWKKAEGRRDIAEIPFTTALHYADLWLGAAHHDMKHFAEHVAPATLASARLMDPLARAPTGADEDDVDLGEWNAPIGLLDEAALMKGVEELVEVLGSPIETTTDQRHERVDHVVLRTADDAVTGKNRPLLAHAAELASVAYRFHRRARAAERLDQVARDLLEGKPGRDIGAVAQTVRMLLVIEAARRAQDAEMARQA